MIDVRRRTAWVLAFRRAQEDCENVGGMAPMGCRGRIAGFSDKPSPIAIGKAPLRLLHHSLINEALLGFFGSTADRFEGGLGMGKSHIDLCYTYWDG